MRWRLFLLLSASTLFVWLGVSWFVHARLLHEVDEIYDAQLQQEGRILAGLVRAAGATVGFSELRDALPKAEFDGIPQVHSIVDSQIRQLGKYERVIGFQVVDSRGNLLFRSAGAPSETFPSRADKGFSDASIQGVRWRVWSFPDDTAGRIVHVGEQYAIRQEISSYLLHSMGMPVLLGIGVIGIFIPLSIASGLKPLSSLARQVRSRRPDDLTAIDVGTASIEIRPIVDALNDLLERVRRSFDNERRFTGDAAHELRTPLAAIRVQSQVALNANDDEERIGALNGVIAGVDRATCLIGQLLELSRLDWQCKQVSDQALRLSAVAEDVAAGFAGCAQEKSIVLTGAGNADTQIRADEALIATLIGNFLDNAIRYSETGGRVRWSVTEEDSHVLLTVTNTGPGIPLEARRAVFERFHRLPGSEAGGSGLGLSIVHKIADLYDAEILLADPPTGRGLEIRVRFPVCGD